MNLFTQALQRVKPIAKIQADDNLLEDETRLFKLASKNRAFPNQLETIYHDYRNYQFLKSNHQLILFGLLIYGSFIISDVIVYEEIYIYPIASRIGYILCVCVVYFNLLISERPLVVTPTTCLLLCFLGGVQSLIGAILIYPPYNHGFITGVVMFLVFGICLFRFCFQKLAMLSLLNIIAFFLYLLFFSNMQLSTVTLSFFFQDVSGVMFLLMIVVSLVGLYMAWLVEQLHRKEWLHKQIVQKSINKQNALVTLLNQRALTDGLTQVYNRRFFDKKLSAMWDWHVQQQKPLSVVMLDLDWFKPYNDNYGHQRGDSCLQKVSSILKQCVDEENTTAQHQTDTRGFIARYGGEEFIILLPDTAHNRASLFANFICQQIYAAHIVHDYSPFGRCSVSVGVATIDKNQVNDSKEVAMAGLVKQADDALYLAKSKGKNCVASMNDIATP